MPGATYAPNTDTAVASRRGSRRGRHLHLSRVEGTDLRADGCARRDAAVPRSACGARLGTADDRGGLVRTDRASYGLSSRRRRPSRASSDPGLPGTPTTSHPNRRALLVRDPPKGPPCATPWKARASISIDSASPPPTSSSTGAEPFLMKPVRTFPASRMSKLPGFSTWAQGGAGSNPVAPTTSNQHLGRSAAVVSVRLVGWAATTHRGSVYPRP
jgi:hypothetical protein